ncbi:spore cortex biosynthesis protein YabQ [Neobacillus sp. LXY-4]|uniref:spore cortex biosynthesis protein YabQ n=1 Tax=Neobacillus sp. LXY-4 TaxID=3379826 RepID=UPI003EDF5CB9
MTLSTQFVTMLTMIGMGSFFGAAFDTYNRFLKRVHRKNWIVFINDVLFWLLQGLIIFYVLFIVNEGEMRFYIYIALLCGFAAYQSLLKGPYLKTLEMIISLIISIWKFIVKLFMMLVYKPLLSLFTFILTILIMSGRGLLSLLLFIWRTLVWIVKLLYKPINMILLLFWKLLPKGIKKNVEKLYNGMAGFFRKIKKYFSNILAHFKKQNK